ncbi:MAG: FAD-binding oxidoreductase [Acidimicrobiales bacterium]
MTSRANKPAPSAGANHAETTAATGALITSDLPSHTRTVMGWGRTIAVSASATEPTSPLQVEPLLTSTGGNEVQPAARGIIPRGLGRSYGDAAQRAGGLVVEMTSLDRLRAWDPASGDVTVDAGTSLDALMRSFLPRGWFVPVTPGTRYVTVGGAIAADVHGKNHHHDGSFGTHVRSLRIATPSCIQDLSPEADCSPDRFWATVAGMGLTGIILEATLRLVPVETAFMRVETSRENDLDATMASLEEGDARYRYSVAWLDCLARNSHLGRSVITLGEHASRDELPSDHAEDPLAFSPTTRLSLPVAPPRGTLNSATVRLFNSLWFHRAPRVASTTVEPLASFFHPLDGVRSWNLLYGKLGFLQYQIVVPFGAEDTIRKVLEGLAAARCPSFLAVLKRFGPSSPAPLSFPMPGWTLALDIPRGPRELHKLLNHFDDIVATAGGRVYLAKDARLQPEHLAAMYPQLEKWRETRSLMDPTHIMRSDLDARLHLAGEP